MFIVSYPFMEKWKFILIRYSVMTSLKSQIAITKLVVLWSDKRWMMICVQVQKHEFSSSVFLKHRKNDYEQYCHIVNFPFSEFCTVKHKECFTFTECNC